MRAHACECAEPGGHRVCQQPEPSGQGVSAAGALWTGCVSSLRPQAGAYETTSLPNDESVSAELRKGLAFFVSLLTHPVQVEQEDFLRHYVETAAATVVKRDISQLVAVESFISIQRA